MKVLLADGFLESVRDKSRYFVKKLEGVAARYPQLATGVRGRGLLLGLVLTEKGIEHGGAMVQYLFEQGVLINFAGNRVLRFVPPLIVSAEEIDMLIEKLCQVLDRFA